RDGAIEKTGRELSIERRLEHRREPLCVDLRVIVVALDERGAAHERACAARREELAQELERRCEREGARVRQLALHARDAVQDRLLLARDVARCEERREIGVELDDAERLSVDRETAAALEKEELPRLQLVDEGAQRVEALGRRASSRLVERDDRD